MERRLFLNFMRWHIGQSRLKCAWQPYGLVNLAAFMRINTESSKHCLNLVAGSVKNCCANFAFLYRIAGKVGNRFSNAVDCKNKVSSIHVARRLKCYLLLLIFVVAMLKAALASFSVTPLTFPDYNRTLAHLKQRKAGSAIRTFFDSVTNSVVNFAIRLPVGD